ncbi:hypothetical protein IFO69_00005 [Echinicola sp. CAU 1574]|uniref:Uncharacterized protein n=1 Tax=Echinicola arenosa TaxID=2774144 RepID=A0ABR9AGQ9_9BACT|nr:hypothetical protein [Echinicola arenosa]MBD8487115.1 hypothetical protein [Echinicola arenosa]
MALLQDDPLHVPFWFKTRMFQNLYKLLPWNFPHIKILPTSTKVVAKLG